MTGGSYYFTDIFVNKYINGVSESKSDRSANTPLLRPQMVVLYNLVYHESVVSVKAASRAIDM